MDENKNLDSNKPDVADVASTGNSKKEKLDRTGREAWLVGGILILIGLIFLFQNLFGFYLENWWALFILIPAFRAFKTGWRELQDADGRLTGASRSAFIKGLILCAVSGFFLFELDWIIFGPILLICAGLALLVNAVLPK